MWLSGAGAWLAARARDDPIMPEPKWPAAPRVGPNDRLGWGLAVWLHARPRVAGGRPLPARPWRRAGAGKGWKRGSVGA